MYLNSSSILSACGDVISSTNELNISGVILLVVVVGGTKGKLLKDGKDVELQLVDDATTVDVTAGRLTGKLTGVVTGGTLTRVVTTAKLAGIVTAAKLAGVITGGELADVVTGGAGITDDLEELVAGTSRELHPTSEVGVTNKMYTISDYTLYSDLHTASFLFLFYCWLFCFFILFTFPLFCFFL